MADRLKGQVTCPPAITSSANALFYQGLSRGLSELRSMRGAAPASPYMSQFAHLTAVLSFAEKGYTVLPQ